MVGLFLLIECATLLVSLVTKPMVSYGIISSLKDRQGESFNSNSQLDELINHYSRWDAKIQLCLCPHTCVYFNTVLFLILWLLFWYD